MKTARYAEAALVLFALLTPTAKADTFVYQVTSTLGNVDVIFDLPTFQEFVDTTTITLADSSDGPVIGFTDVASAAPEQSSLALVPFRRVSLIPLGLGALIPLGLGALLLMRKLMIQLRPIGSVSKPKRGNEASAVSASLLLNPLFRILNLPCRNWQELDWMTQLYVDAFRAMSVEQRDALHYLEANTWVHLARPEVIKAQNRWNSVRHRSVLRFIPDLRFGLRSEWHRAICIGLVFLAALALAIVYSLWAATLFLLALLYGIAAIWACDLIVMRRLKKCSVTLI